MMTKRSFQRLSVGVTMLAAITLAGCSSGSDDTASVMTGTPDGGEMTGTPDGGEMTGTPPELIPGDGLSISTSAPVVAADDTGLQQLLANPGNVFPALTATLYRALAPGSEGSDLSKDFHVDTIHMDAQGAYVVSYVLNGTPGTVTISDSDAIGGGEYSVEVDGTPFSFWSWTSTKNDPFFRYMDVRTLTPDFR